ncbi:M48 family metallopeptidase [Haloplasma contractile]|uniref:Zinc metalloprotease protein n=1 Tax=Haloplasma contractile SSD-17B TaxID=1033810 RepID=U2EB11_9MOLU|nr:SprT family zinc-dependent metalloprotease [Haloplasma contractile]ERJ12293.1 Zinc metalloprotease protein [Haloplasma contractile SSD-17B]
MNVYQVRYSGHTIEFELHRKKVKHVNLNVKPDMTVIVSAGEEVPLEFITDFVKEKAQWILKQVNYFKEVQPENKTEKEYISGETFKYLGKQYRLKVKETDDSEEVKLYRGYFHLYIKDKKYTKKKEALLDEWFRAKAKIKFNESLERVYPLVEKYQIQKPDIIIRTMKARWGSCLREKKTIQLNFDLIKAPKFCIDYVVLHELIHFIHKNHDKQFYQIQTVLMPDWKSRKAILDEEVVREL